MSDEYAPRRTFLVQHKRRKGKSGLTTQYERGVSHAAACDRLAELVRDPQVLWVYVEDETAGTTGAG